MGSDEKICQSEELQMSKVSRKSLTLNNSIKKGDKINLKHLCLKRPGTGIFYGQLKKIVGKKAKRNLKKNYQIKFTDIN